MSPKQTKTKPFVVLTGHLEVKNKTYKRHDVARLTPGVYTDMLVKQRKIESLKSFQARKVVLELNPETPQESSVNSPLLDINGCTVQELVDAIPGVGPKRAADIAASRPFYTKQEAVERFPVLANANLALVED